MSKRVATSTGGWGINGVTRTEPICNIPLLEGEECANKIPQSCVLVKEEDNSPFCKRNTRVGVRLVATEASEYGQKGIRAYPTQKVAQLRCFYTNARCMGNKQEEQEAIVWSESYDIVATMETWWDDSHSWSAVMDGYQLFKRDRQGRKGSGVALYIKKECEYMKINYSDYRVVSLRVRQKRRPIKLILSWEFSTGHPTRMERWTRHFIDS